MILLNRKEIKQAVDYINNNKIIIIPTDTIYGISTKVSAENLGRINRIKHRELNKDIIILVANIKQAKMFIDINKLIKNLLLSRTPTTVIYKKEGSEKTFAIRLCKRKDIKKILKKVGPIYSTSVNISGENYIFSKDKLYNFSKEIFFVFFTEELKNKPSEIFDVVNNKKNR